MNFAQALPPDWHEKRRGIFRWRTLPGTFLADDPTLASLIGTDPVERTQALDALTTNHTSFFRESHHFDHFMEHCWPALDAPISQFTRRARAATR